MKPMRRYTFRPYIRRPVYPHFILTTYETNRRDSRGCYYIGYKLVMRQGGVSTVIFQGEDFNAGPMHAIDSVGAAHGLMGFLTLRPGDTDAEYFEKYTPAQLDFAASHAESLVAEIAVRWESSDGSLKKRYR